MGGGRENSSPIHLKSIVFFVKHKNVFLKILRDNSSRTRESRRPPTTSYGIY